MKARQIDGFFYGLFMDAQVLREAGTDPANLRHAYVDDFELRIGQRATLVPSPGSRAYGMLISLTHAELDHLYGAPGLESYRPEAVVARGFSGQAYAALCYNLVKPPALHERNPDYALKLRRVLKQLEFSDEYVESVQ